MDIGADPVLRTSAILSGVVLRAGDPAGLTHSKVMRRSADLLALARRYREEGVPANNIVLTGHSAGGFASLLAQLDAPDAAGHVVAFAPAFVRTRGRCAAQEKPGRGRSSNRGSRRRTG